MFLHKTRPEQRHLMESKLTGGLRVRMVLFAMPAVFISGNQSVALTRRIKSAGILILQPLYAASLSKTGISKYKEESIGYTIDSGNRNCRYCISFMQYN